MFPALCYFLLPSSCPAPTNPGGGAVVRGLGSTPPPLDNSAPPATCVELACAVCACVCVFVSSSTPPSPSSRTNPNLDRDPPMDPNDFCRSTPVATDLASAPPPPARDENPDPPIALHGSKSPPDVLNSESGNMAAAGRVEVSALATGAAFVDWDPTGGPLALVDCGPFGGQLALDRGADAAATGVPSLGLGAVPSGAEQAGPGPRSPLRGFSLFFGRGGGGGVSVRAPVAASEREPARRSLQDAAIVIERLRPEQPRERRLVVDLVSILRLRPPAPVVVPRAEQQVTHAPVQGVEPARVAPAAGAKGEGPGAPVGGEVAAAAQGGERRAASAASPDDPNPRGAGG